MGANTEIGSAAHGGERVYVPLLLVQGILVVVFWVVAYSWGQSSDTTIEYSWGGAILQWGLFAALVFGHTGVRYFLFALALASMIVELSSVVAEPHSPAAVVLAIIAAMIGIVVILEWAWASRRERSSSAA